MDLYLLKARKELIGAKGSPWASRYDCMFGFVIRAENEWQARQFAARRSSGEEEQAWLDEKNSTCEVLLAEGQPGIVLFDFNPG